MIAVVIPTYKCKKHILGVISEIGSEVQKIYVVDDCCPDKTGQFVKEKVTDPRVQLIFNSVNLGVGGAVIAGYQQAKKDGCKIVVKVDGDGQMDPRLIPRFIKPILNGDADYTKGNRFNNLEDLAQMPKLRMFGNAGLSFFSKLSSGYWSIFDPTNGYTAIHTSILDQLFLSKVSKRYFFESDLLFRLNICQAVVLDIPMSAKYADEKSNLNEVKVIPMFLWGHIRNFLKRIGYNYFLRNFSIASLYLLIGIPLLLFSIIYGISNWYYYYTINSNAPSGTVMLAALTFIISFQMILNFFNFDMSVKAEKTLASKMDNL